MHINIAWSKSFNHPIPNRPARPSLQPPLRLRRPPTADRRQHRQAQQSNRNRAMASADLLRREEFYSSLFDSAKGNANALPAAPADGDAGFAPLCWNCGLWKQAMAPGRAHSWSRGRSRPWRTWPPGWGYYSLPSSVPLATLFLFSFSSLLHGRVKNFPCISFLMTNENKN